MKVKGTVEVNKNLDKVLDNLRRKSEEVIDYTLRDSVNYAKTNAPWTDRTGLARRSIDSSVKYKRPNVFGFHLGIGAEYGVYLELSNQGKYRIIWPTIEQKTKKDLLRNIRKFIRY